MELEKQKQCNNSNYALLFVAVYCYCCYCCFSCECFFEGIVNVEYGVFEIFLMTFFLHSTHCPPVMFDEFKAAEVE